MPNALVRLTSISTVSMYMAIMGSVAEEPPVATVAKCGLPREAPAAITAGPGEESVP